jgi:RNA recognition motif-containing protein
VPRQALRCKNAIPRAAKRGYFRKTLYHARMKILVRNLPRTTTEEELHALFSAHGAVQSCTVVMDKATGISKGFGFVEMPKVGDAKGAMKTLNGLNIAGSTLRVKKAETTADDDAAKPVAAAAKTPAEATSAQTARPRTPRTAKAPSARRDDVPAPSSSPYRRKK